MGNDQEAKRIFGGYGIKDARELAAYLHDHKVSIMLGFQSFNPEIQDALVGRKGHTQVRNQALENLVAEGWQEDSPSRLCLCNAPVTQATQEDAFDIHVFARERGLYSVAALSMTSGKQFNHKFLNVIDLTHTQKEELFTRIYSWNIERGIQTLDQIEEEGISAMPGSHPCNQVATGLYVTANGEVVRCPGFNQSLGNVREENVRNIWERSENFRRAGTFNCGCPPKEGVTLPNDLFEKVLKNLRSKYGN